MKCLKIGCLKVKYMKDIFSFLRWDFESFFRFFWKVSHKTFLAFPTSFRVFSSLEPIYTSMYRHVFSLKVKAFTFWSKTLQNQNINKCQSRVSCVKFPILLKKKAAINATRKLLYFSTLFFTGKTLFFRLCTFSYKRWNPPFSALKHWSVPNTSVTTLCK